MMCVARGPGLAFADFDLLGPSYIVLATARSINPLSKLDMAPCPLAAAHAAAYTRFRARAVQGDVW